MQKSLTEDNSVGNCDLPVSSSILATKQSEHVFVPAASCCLILNGNKNAENRLFYEKNAHLYKEISQKDLHFHALYVRISRIYIGVFMGT